jgi:hypothetical protein
MKKGPGWKMGTDIKAVVDRTTKKDVPGSGAYNIEQKHSKEGGAWGRSGRFTKKENDTPAPGNYKLPSKVAETPWHMKGK